MMEMLKWGVAAMLLRASLTSVTPMSEKPTDDNTAPKAVIPISLGRGP